MKGDVSSARRSVLREALIYALILAAILFAWGSSLVGVLQTGAGIGIFFLVLLTTLGILAIFQDIQALRDLAAAPVVTEGPILRKWRRAEVFFFPAHHIFVNRRVFRIPTLFYEQLEEEDTVSITHFPHTATVIAVELVRRAERERKD